MAQRIDSGTQSGPGTSSPDFPSAGAIPYSEGARPFEEALFEAASPRATGQGSLGRRYRPAAAPDFQVTGVACGGTAAFALIADATGNQKMYRNGDSVRPGVVLKEVLPDGVILEIGGERLPLRIRTFAGNAARSDAPINPARRQGVDSVRSRRPSISSPDVLLPGLFTVHAAGGLQLENVKPGSVYARIGLHVGDVLRSANATALVSPDQVAAFQQQVNEGGEGKVEVLRDGRLEVLRYGKK
jgi:type II secretory pathway component PulC